MNRPCPGRRAFVAGSLLLLVAYMAFADEQFRDPPPAARPLTLWFWMNGHISREGITLDLEAMSRVGIGGAMIFDGSNYFPDGPAPYMSPRWLSLITHAVEEGDRLGVNIGMHNAPGWSSSGGPWITPDNSMKYLTWTEMRAAGGDTIRLMLPEPQSLLSYYRDARVIAYPTPRSRAVSSRLTCSRVVHSNVGELDNALLADQQLDSSITVDVNDIITFFFDREIEARSLTVNSGLTGNLPQLRLESSSDGEVFVPVAELLSHGRHGIIAPVSRSFPLTGASVFRLVALSDGTLGEVSLNVTPRIDDWEFKTNLAYQVGKQVEMPGYGHAADAIDPDDVVDISAHMDTDGRLQWDAPAGDWTILRIGYTTTAHLNVAASAAGTGLESDKLDPRATELSFNNTVGRVIDAVGPLTGKSFKYVEIDSYEAGVQNWTSAFPEEFFERAGYDLTPYLPVLTGRIVGNAGIAERFLFDFRTVQAAMMAEHYYGRMGELTAAHGLDLYVEGYGQGMFDEIEVSGSAPVPMTEFWVRTPWTPNRSVKVVASAAHVYGKSIVAAESFTGEEKTSRWLGYPYALKAEGDYMFSQGQNQILFHRFVHQPHPTAVPGMAMGPWGSHFDRTNTWFEYARPWMEYLARSQYLLQQGHPVADILFFTGERPPTTAQWIRPALPAGYDFDHIDAKALLERVTVENREFSLPEGNRYQLLVLPESLAGMTPALLQKLYGFVEQGAKVMGPRPEYSLSLRGYPDSEASLQQIANQLWSNSRDDSILPSQPLEQALNSLGVAPDFRYTSTRPDAAISWNHRKIEAGDLYFIANRQRRVDELVVSFRVTGGEPQILNAETGEQRAAALFEIADGRTRLPLHLGPAESVFVLIPPGKTVGGHERLLRDSETVMSTTPVEDARLPATVDTFTMAVWARPDIVLRLMPEESTTGRIDETGKFYVISAPEGDRLFGDGHAAVGLAVGHNGIYVVERTSDSAPAVLVSEQPISGWNHIAVVYRDGRPSLYVNGDWVKDGLQSGSVVHPAVNLPASQPDAVLHFSGLEHIATVSGISLPPTQGRVYTFEGNLSDPEVYDRALSPAEIRELAVEMPAPFSLPPTVLNVDEQGLVAATIFQSGHYGLDSGEAEKVEVAEPIGLNGPWQVSFQPDRGAPASTTLPRLMSLHRHDDDGVRYFSGEAIYKNNVVIPEDWLAPDRRVVLDLGRVDVVAAVRINGVELPVLWKEPYRVDVTEAAQAGDNTLEVTVVNLWSNRLIGDEHLPADVEYGYDAGRDDSPFFGKGIKSFPDWYLRGKSKPEGGRVTFTTWHFYDANEPLVSSGLLGPVQLLNPVVRILP